MIAVKQGLLSARNELCLDLIQSELVLRDLVSEGLVQFICDVDSEKIKHIQILDPDSSSRM